MRILSLSTVFPNPQEAGLGLFVHRRLHALARLARVRVVAPIGPFDYDNPARRGIGSRSTPRERSEEAIERIYHPAWLYPPGNGWVKGPLLAAQLIPLLARIRKSYRFDLIDAHFLHPEGISAWLMARTFSTPFVMTLRGNELAYVRKSLHRPLMGRAARAAARLFPVSEQLGDLARQLGATPAQVLPIGNGVDASVYRPSDAPPPRNGRRLLILSAGRLIELKGFHHIVRAVKILVDRGFNAELQIAGEAGRGMSSYAGELSSLAASLGVADRVELLGWVPPIELARRMSRADVFCLASSREGWPNVIAEAMACGSPVVATDAGDVRRMIPSDRYGLWVPPGDPTKLANALADALCRDWDRSALSAYAQERSWDQVAREIAAELEAVLIER